jgi:predicted TIM-barrel fold metal-dependent hydrolase
MEADAWRDATTTHRATKEDMMSERTQSARSRSPANSVPAGAWDCHRHVFGPFDRFPPAAAGAYALPYADRRRHSHALGELGFAHALLVQPSVYGTDHAAMLDAIEHSSGRFRGIGSCDGATTHRDLEHLRARGIVGLRFVAVTGPGGGAYPGTQGLEAWRCLRPLMVEVGLHAHLWADGDTCAVVAHDAAAVGETLVLDHLAGLHPEDRPGSERFDRLADALASGTVWVKMTWFRRSHRPGDYSDMEATVCALAECAPERVLWGSDWPFVRVETVPNAAALIGQLHAWIGSEAFERCLRANPQALLSADA